MLCTTPNRKHNHHPLSTTAPENCLPYLVLLFLCLMTHPLHQEMPPCVVIPYLEKLAYLRSPSSSVTSYRMVEPDFQCMPSQILNNETTHQQQLAFSLLSRNLFP
uniref:Uncharacterized protein n=1 Tax=Lotus japonicus TaxID=34305 RepID=I3SQU4_LOTJA|nr:unknown [Lotus japonicus]